MGMKFAKNNYKERPIICTDKYQQCLYLGGWVGAFGKTKCSDFQGGKNPYTQKYNFHHLFVQIMVFNPILICFKHKSDIRHLKKFFERSIEVNLDMKVQKCTDFFLMHMGVLL